MRSKPVWTDLSTVKLDTGGQQSVELAARRDVDERRSQNSKMSLCARRALDEQLGPEAYVLAWLRMLSEHVGESAGGGLDRN